MISLNLIPSGGPLWKRAAKMLLRKNYVSQMRLLRQLERVPRYTLGATTLLGPLLQYVDAASFLFMAREILGRETYRFDAQTRAPRILDLGANIGISCLYFKQQYPEAKISAFEADPAIARILRINMETAGVTDVEIVEAAAWIKDGEVTFFSEGADAGRLVRDEISCARKTVRSIRFRDRLLREEHVDLLKIDIEGSETAVLDDCESCLGAVERVFVEYHSFENEVQSLARLLEILSNAGFRLSITPSFHALQPFVSRPANIGMDLRLNVFAFRNKAGQL